VTDGKRKQIRATTDPATLRSRFGQVLVVVVWAILAAVFVSLVVEWQLLPLLKYTPVIALGAYGVWLLMWSPSVTIAPSGVTIRNLLRTNDVTWPAIQRIDTRFALTLYTAVGKIVAWSAPAPSRFAALRATRSDLSNLPESSYIVGSIRPGDIPKSDSGLAALYVRRYYEQLRDAGHLASGVVEGTGVVTKWLPRESLILVGLILLSLGAIKFVP
jgi:Bacterial PH domain